MFRLLTVLAILLGMAAHAQQQVLVVVGDTTLPRKWRGPFTVGKTELDVRKADLRSEMIAAGYLAASCDSCVHGNDTTRCYFHLGTQYRWARLAAGTIPQEIASASGFRERLYRDRPITPRQMAGLFEDLLDQCENNGFPFAMVQLDSIRQQGEGLSAVIDLTPGRAIVFDSVIVRGTVRVNPRYLQAHIGIRPGDPYNESLVQALNQRIKELPFITSKRSPYILFSPEETKLYLFLDAKNASSFNGILGVAPDPSTGKVNLTGDVDLKLRNALHHGEAIALNWRSLQDKTQNLTLGFNYPYAFNTPFGVDLGLKLFKQDSTFLQVNSRAALEYLLSRGDKVSIFVNNASSQRLGQQLVYMPGLADVKLTSYGLGLQRQHFDYLYNPRKGLGLNLEGSAGEKHSSTATYGDTVSTPQTSVQYVFDGNVTWHIPLGRRSTVRLVAQGGSMVNDQLYTNELYRIGGLKTLRGVDEASIYCSSYAIGTVEYRFLYEENGNFFLFMDQGWWEDSSQSPMKTDTPIGFGVGTSFETKAGIFGLTYALGRQFNNPIDLRGGKVYFGFTSLF
ncbi:MAG: POTRA domain-containing protein [Flavobacteriales bacterium]